jgi:hypothetical protein
VEKWTVCSIHQNSRVFTNARLIGISFRSQKPFSTLIYHFQRKNETLPGPSHLPEPEPELLDQPDSYVHFHPNSSTQPLVQFQHLLCWRHGDSAVVLVSLWWRGCDRRVRALVMPMSANVIHPIRVDTWRWSRIVDARARLVAALEIDVLDVKCMDVPREVTCGSLVSCVSAWRGRGGQAHRGW